MSKIKDTIEKVFKETYYTGRIVRYLGERKVIARSFINENEFEKSYVVFVDGKKCSNLKEIELDGRK